MSSLVNTGIKVPVDVLIIGGGIAGLWSLARLKQAGYKAVLLEAEALGAGQTRYAQGIIHGGTKYALTGKLTASSEAVSGMPSRWRACYRGEGDIDLSRAILLSESHYLWSTSSLSSRVSGFFASKLMRSRTAEVDRDSMPEVFQHNNFKGRVYALDEPVFDTLSVVHALADPRMSSVLVVDGSSYQHQDKILQVATPEGECYEFSYQKLVLMAGQGNETMLSLLAQIQPSMQLRPLKMVMVRGNLPGKLYAHCMATSVNPRITITTHYDKQGEVVWYLGGQLAEDGVTRSDEEQLKQARSELGELMPWLELSATQWSVLDIDRAEVKNPDGKRPDTFYAEQRGDIITAWPTKMALSPLLADKIVELIDSSSMQRVAADALPPWPQAQFTDFPWCEEFRWN